MSTPPVPPADKGAPEHDPTGIRDLLASLPDPGPMPADLVARINASIAAEQSAREDSTVVPLRPRRWGWQHVGVAAAAAAVLGIGLPALLTGTGPGDLMASFGGGQSADSAGGASVESRTDTGSDSGTTAGEVPRPATTTPGGQRVASSPGPVTLGASGTAYTATALATQAGSKLTTAQDGAMAAPKARRGVAESPTGLRACLSAIGVAAWMPVRGDLATLDGEPAVIALVSSDTGQTVYAVAPGCSAAHPGVLAGPLRVP